MNRKIKVAIFTHSEPLLVSFAKLLLKTQSCRDDAEFSHEDTPETTDVDTNADIVFINIKTLWKWNKRLPQLRDLFKNKIVVVMSAEGVDMYPRAWDWSFSFEPHSKTNFCSSTACCWLTYKEHYEAEKVLTKTKFCHFIYSNGNAVERIQFAKKLMNYKKVDCMGAVLNNAPVIPHCLFLEGTLPLELKPYKFGIAFENHRRPHYTTEKIFQCFAAGNVPIYWGNPKAAEIINPEAFINCHDFNSFDEVIEHVIEADNNDALYRRYLDAQPVLPDSPLVKDFDELLTKRINKIVDSAGRINPISSTWLYLWRLRCHRLQVRSYYKAKIDGRKSFLLRSLELIIRHLMRHVTRLIP